jgi:hypothetical protein
MKGENGGWDSEIYPFAMVDYGTDIIVRILSFYQ